MAPTLRLHRRHMAGHMAVSEGWSTWLADKESVQVGPGSWSRELCRIERSARCGCRGGYCSCLECGRLSLTLANHAFRTMPKDEPRPSREESDFQGQDG
jgi:hypothetical protein